MPELPEVESIRLQLERDLIGKVIRSVGVCEPRCFHGDADSIIGAEVKKVNRKGKILIIELKQSNNQLSIINNFISIHLKLSGQVLFAENKDKAVFKNTIPRANTKTMPGKTTRVIINFDDNSALYFNDMRKFGWVKVGEKPETTIGEDVLSKHFTLKYFKKAIRNTRRPIKVVLMDQNKMAGIGNIYANDALWEAKIHPARKTNSLTDDEKKTLYESILNSINEGIKYKGSSARDELYIMPDGSLGTYQHHFKTYHQDGEKCQRCGAEIKRMKLAGRGTFYCPECQVF